MSCCASYNYKVAATARQHRHSAAGRSEYVGGSKATVVPSEDETVKEVQTEIEEKDKQRGFRPLDLRKMQEQDDKKNVDKKMPFMKTEEVAEVSKICSLSEVSISTAAEKREDDGGGGGGGEEARQRKMNKSPAKFRNRASSDERRDMTAASKSPAKRFGPSPGRRRLVPGRESRAVEVDGKRRDLGESSGRRSRCRRTKQGSSAEGTRQSAYIHV